MKKNFFLAAVAIVALASCSSDERIGDVISPDISPTSEAGAIMFSPVSKSITRADHVGADAAALLNKHFTVGGFKGAGDVTATTVATGTVFDNYIVNWTENTAATTASNTSDWEYSGITAAAPSILAGNTQSIKYWDYSAAQYDFIAYSTGTATAVTGTPTSGQVTVTAIDPANAKTAAYTLAGASADLEKCYIADMVTVYKGADYGKEVKLTFRSLASKVRVALYETVPGYSIKDVKFYTDRSTTLEAGASASNATLFTTGTADKDYFYTAGTYTVSFPTIGSSNQSKSDYNKAHVTLAATGKETTKAFTGLNYIAAEYKEKTTGNIWLGRSSATASYAGASDDNYYQLAMPNEEGTVLELRVDYTLESIDGSGETITIHGATAYVPAIYAAWKPNYAYTYIFKISDNTNGWTSTVNTDPTGLYPITFDAVVSETTDNTQATITTVATPSITTYQKGHDVTKNEYAAGDIYVQIMQDGTLKADLDSKGQLYTITAREGKTVSEADVMDALNIQSSVSGDVTTGRNGWVLTKATSDASITAIPGADGNNITVTAKTAAKFTATASTTYAYVYSVSTGTASTYTTAVKFTSKPTGWPTGFYTDEACSIAAVDGDWVADKFFYQKYTNNNNVYGVKVIKVP